MAAAIASATPVLPLVPSTMVPPALSRPSRSARSMIGIPIRSFTEPPGLKISAFANTGVRIPRVTLLRRMSGVQPMVSSTVSYGARFRSTAAEATEALCVMSGRFLVSRFEHRVARKGRRLWMAKIDGEQYRDRQWCTLGDCRTKPQYTRTCDRGRIERRISRALQHRRRFRLYPTRCVDVNAQGHVPLHFLRVQLRRILERQLAVLHHRQRVRQGARLQGLDHFLRIALVD